MLIDTHCHLTHEQYGADLGPVLSRAASLGVSQVVGIASDLADAEALLRLREQLRSGLLPGVGEGETRIFTTAGVHPNHLSELPSDPGAEREALEHLIDLLARPGVVAIGECGLDYHYDYTPPSVQARWFERHIQLAAETRLPLVVHCREAESAMIPRVREAGEAGVRGVLHCFPGDLELLETAMQAGWCVSFTGNVTFKSFQGVEAVRQVPRGRYFLETDGPYMTPVPHRGTRNEPGTIPLIRDRIAELRNEPWSQVAEDTTAAAHQFFHLPRL
jgi:TatD DNase family protein